MDFAFALSLLNFIHAGLVLEAFLPSQSLTRWLCYSILVTTRLTKSAWVPVWEPRCRRQCLVTACVASKQLWCLFCVIWRACCPGSIQGFHTSLTHFSLPGFLLTGHKLSGGRGGLRSEKKDQSGPNFSGSVFISRVRWVRRWPREEFPRAVEGKRRGKAEFSDAKTRLWIFSSRDGAFRVHPLGATLLLTLYVILMSVAA